MIVRTALSKKPVILIIIVDTDFHEISVLILYNLVVTYYSVNIIWNFYGINHREAQSCDRKL
jgi:hypothetical protein